MEDERRSPHRHRPEDINMDNDMNHDNANLVIDDKALQQVENQVIDFVRRNSSLEAAKHLQLA